MSRINENEILKHLKETPLKALGKRAYEIKNTLHSDKITTFIIDRNINYTNICWVDCKFCAFKRRINEEGSYILSFEEIDKKIDELIAIGGTQILFQGGVHPTLKLDWYESLVSHIHNKYPNITIHGFSAIEIDYISKVSKVSIKETLESLKKAGLSSIPGAGAEVLSDRVRDIIAPKKLDSLEWIEIHKQAHYLDMKTTATMMFGSVDNEEDIINHFRLIRELQDETNGFRAFILWSFQPDNTPLQSEFPHIKKASSNRYLRYLSASRIYLDNFKNIQSSWVTQGSFVGQLALSFGANDLGSTMMEENVVASAGARNKMNTDEMIKVIRDAGEIPAIRDTAYNILKMC
ncbi:dehypoxanthine futalosine cyclase [Helicobacter sp. MIT 14-3879]|uniref:dehypoxanthine futalosine cyclase n=1 Tax=Helicobacter sp. MIT 14-3879 TaxID=2040649 RepID=UPI000E1EDF43|nr:dehypoxanthine futalosine cyclase [Helicobacter sp. MIT 14-3879]RDU64687.1 dehypoxanthine futalosine cyclase [Helicobacter sp. MIT 14-3879]